MWLWIAAGAACALIFLTLAVTGVLFFGALHRMPEKKRDSMQKNASSLLSPLDAYRGVMDANEYDFEFLTLGDIVGRWEGESVFLQSGRRDTLSGHRRTASSMTKEER